MCICSLVMSDVAPAWKLAYDADPNENGVWDNYTKKQIWYLGVQEQAEKNHNINMRQHWFKMADEVSVQSAVTMSIFDEEHKQRINVNDKYIFYTCALHSIECSRNLSDAFILFALYMHVNTESIKRNGSILFYSW